ncbi:uncharacterized protein LOC123716456 [Pieris brassicae]|uniref:uncharacterized protein LOC123716456 n=1 Tax=Pieris brassicae TaxID=7116 RepID=UPI001E65FD47|nr:uncharacterized protein LOC123716456 [Pieris brassicae]
MAESAPSTEYATSEMPVSEAGEATPAGGYPGGFPPYPPYATETVPPSVADTIMAGRDLRVQHKSLPKQTVRPPPKPARPRGPKATDVKLSKRAARAHARCLKRHGAVLTDRLERMSRPPLRSVIYLWRQYARMLPADTIARLRTMLDADQPFKPEQAYEYFINLKKSKKKGATIKINQFKKDILALCGDKRFVWARNATVAFARGIQQRLSKPGSYALADGMLRLSNIILEDLCSYMHTRPPSRRATHPKAKFMMEMADKIAVWIDEILAESEDRMLMMDFDEDEDLIGADEAGDAGFADDFLNMMGGDGGLLKLPLPAYLNFTGEMLEAFNILTESMYDKGDAHLLTHGKFTANYSDGADELKQAIDFNATDFNSTVANQLKQDIGETAASKTTEKLKPFMKEMVEICSNYLAQFAEYNKDKGPAFKFLVKTMKTKGAQQLYQKGKAKRTYGKAATELEDAKGVESDHDDPNLSQEIHSALSKLVEGQTPADLKEDMKGTLDICSKYLSQCAVDEIERGPAFDLLIKELEKNGQEPFTPQYSGLPTRFVAAYTLKSAPGLSSSTPDPTTAPVFLDPLHKAVDTVTPKNLKKDMNEVIERCANYLSAFIRDRDKAMQALLQVMKNNPKNEVVKRNNYLMTYDIGAKEIETSPLIMPYMPIKDIADEAKEHLTNDVEKVTPPDLKIAMKAVVQDVAKFLSQPSALRSGVAGERYPLNFLAAIKKSLGSKSLFKYKAFGQTYADGADVLKYSGPLESDPKAENLECEIAAEIERGVPPQLSPTMAIEISATMETAAKHLAKVGMEKGEALEHLVNLMKDQGESPMGLVQGYQQSYNDGARRIELSKSLATDKVDKGTYESLLEKFNGLVEAKPNNEYAKVMPGIIDDAAKFLAAPLPENAKEKRQLLADLMARKGDEILREESIYKMTYTEGGQELVNAPVGVTTARDAAAKDDILQKIKAVIPDDKKIQDILKEPAKEGAAYLADIIKGRGEAMQVIHDGLKKEKDKDFLTLGNFSKNHEQVADMLSDATHFGGQNPSPVVVDKVSGKMQALPLQYPESAKPFAKETSDIAVNFVAGVATKECGLDPKALAELDEKRAAARARAAATQVSAPTASQSTTALDAEEAARLQRLQAARRREHDDKERDEAMNILHGQLRARGGETMYKQPHTELTHALASDWLSMKPPMKVDKAVKESGDTARLHKKFERKLSGLVSKCTPADMYDTMQDVIIESSRILSEYFVTKSYKGLVREALISEMQKRGNEILIEVDGAAETYFFAAQRLKKASSLDVPEPCAEVSYFLSKKLDDMIRCRSMARKLTSAMKDHSKEASDYLSAHVTKPDEQIEAYVTLLNEMEAAGDSLLIEGNIPKSYKDSAAYLRQLTSYEDQIRRPDAALQSETEGRLQNLMSNVTSNGSSKAVKDGVITDSTKLLVSYIMLLVEKTEALKVLIEQMDLHGGNVLLRHGKIRKTYAEGADMLRSKNADQLSVANADPVVVRKIQIKLRNIMHCFTPEKFVNVIDDVIEDATMYLAVHFLQPQIIQVCKCMKNVFVQCELWCDEILRRVARPCCSCSRHISTQALSDLAPGPIHATPGSSRAYADGLEITIGPCPTRVDRTPRPCPATRPTDECGRYTTTSYLFYSPASRRRSLFYSPERLCPEAESLHISRSRESRSPVSTNRSFGERFAETITKEVRNRSPTPIRETDTSSSFYTPQSGQGLDSDPPEMDVASPRFWNSPTTMYAEVFTPNVPHPPVQPTRPGNPTLEQRESNSRAPIVSTEQMSDWHAMLVSLMWNVQAWRDWIQENFDRALAFQQSAETPGQSDESWRGFQRRVATEALQWRQYNKFSRQLTLRLALRYRDKQIVSPTRGTVKTNVYIECQQEMLDIIDMFNKWTVWLTLVIKETDSLQHQPDTDSTLTQVRWNHFKRKIQEYAEDWQKYNTHLKGCWEQKHKKIISEWVPSWGSAGPVWVVSACGAVPSGAVPAGLYEGELTWLARTTHKCNVLPAALHPSKHCCVVYADGAVHHYTKYQVMCNAEVRWVAWRAGAGVGGSGGTGGRAVRVAPGVHAGRVHYRGSHLVGAVHAPHYRCHVVIYGRPFAFNCYELLLLAD